MDYQAAIQYLLEHHQKFAVQAVQNAMGQVRTAHAGSKKHHSYSPSVNKHLCEALFFVNSDPNAPTSTKSSIRHLIKEYRNINNMPTDDIPFSVENDDVAGFILENTETDAEYNVADIQRVITENTNFTPEDISEAINELVYMGYFSVAERNGNQSISVIRNA